MTGAFFVAVSCDEPGETGDKWADIGLGLLAAALREWGVGGKTSSGYGRTRASSGGRGIAPPTVGSKRCPKALS